MKTGRVSYSNDLLTSRGIGLSEFFFTKTLINVLNCVFRSGIAVTACPRRGAVSSELYASSRAVYDSSQSCFRLPTSHDIVRTDFYSRVIYEQSGYHNKCKVAPDRCFT